VYTRTCTGVYKLVRVQAGSEAGTDSADAAGGRYIYTAATVAVRKLLNPEAKGGASIPPLDIAKISTVVGAYLAVSSNIRYQARV
jgi:hypothetical protein